MNIIIQHYEGWGVFPGFLATARALIPTNWEKEKKKRKGCQISIQRGYSCMGKK
jgi:hypothetical protein